MWWKVGAGANLVPLLRARQVPGITDLLGEAGSETRLGPGDLHRRTPADVAAG